MNRLDFVLPEWTRVMWVSAEAERVWSDRISKIMRAWTWVESMRQSWLHVIPQDGLIEFQKQVPIGRELIVLGRQGTGGMYSSSMIPFEAGKPYNYRVVVTSPFLKTDWIKAWDAQDNRAIGNLLQYPDCCIDFFQKYWVDGKYVDSTWVMGDASGGNFQSVVCPPENNILLRWMGVRLVSHLPCSHRCTPTRRIGENNLDLMSKRFPDEADWIEQLLAMPVEWSAFGGVAEIQTPLFKISSRTDATGETLKVQRFGWSYPKEGVKGLKFPNTETQFQGDDVWKLNNFGSLENQNRLHRFLLMAIPDDLKAITVLDIGCGNGMLAGKISEKLNSAGGGFDLDEAKIAKAEEMFPGGTFYQSNLGGPDLLSGEYDLIVCSTQRFKENPNPRIVANVLDRGKNFLFYNYDRECFSEVYKPDFIESDIRYKRGPATAMFWSKKESV